MPTALVFGYYGKDNIGDDAMLQVIALQLGRLGVKTVAVSHNPKKTKRDFGIEAISHKADLQKLDYDFFVLGGGTQIQDYRLGGFKALVKFFLKARKPGVKTCLLSIGVAKLGTKKGRVLARKLCNNSDLVIVRDRESRSELQRAGVKKRIFVSADLTFALPKKPGRGKRNSICFCPIPFYEIFELSPKKDKALAGEIAKAVDLVQERTKAGISILPFFKSYDTAFCKSILKQVKSKRVKLLSYRPLGLALAKEFEKFGLVVGMRFHSLVFAAFLGKPFVAVAFTAKTRNFVNALDWYSFAVGPGFKAGQLAEKTIKAFEERAKLGKRVQAKREKLHKLSSNAFKLFKQKLM